VSLSWLKDLDKFASTATFDQRLNRLNIALQSPNSLDKSLHFDFGIGWFWRKELY